MPISLMCPSCAVRMIAPDDLAGKQGKCPKCQTVFLVPLLTASLQPSQAPSSPISNASALVSPPPVIQLPLAKGILEPRQNLVAPAKTPEQSLPREVFNSIGMKFVLIPPGKFLMGSPLDEREYIRIAYGKESGDWSDQELQHEVEITRPFYLASFQVTQEQYQRIMSKNPSRFSTHGEGREKVRGMDTSRFPVETVTWGDAMEFCVRLSNLPEEKIAGRKYRLPTEAEWEYACRKGESCTSEDWTFVWVSSTGEPIIRPSLTCYRPFSFGNALSSMEANFKGNNSPDPYGNGMAGPYLERTCVVGSYQPNAFGLFDMHGNVWEWCSDWYEENYYKHSPIRDPRGPENGTQRVVRGGSWSDGTYGCRAAFRFGLDPYGRGSIAGFRVCLQLD